MYTYVTQELPALLASDAMDPLHRISLQYRSISGHSMGGHGALTIAFKQPEAWCSVSALAPIVDPTAGAEACPWVRKRSTATWLPVQRVQKPLLTPR